MARKMGEVQEPSGGESSEGDLVGRVLAGRYRIQALIGMGGMGAVYRAEHVHMRKAMAVKVLHREMTQMPEVVARFEREAVAAARIADPHVAAVTDFGRLEDGSFYLALEFLQGRSLAQLMKREGPLPEQRALRIARQIAEALGAAHAADVVHRDLKPDNVMLIERPGNPDFVKVLDFGIAKVRLEASSGDQPLTQMGMVFGTPEYMSPEQAQGLEVDARADLYTLGVILYEMLSGRSPFRHEDLVVVLTRHITAEPPPLPDSISPATAELVLVLLAKLPAQRPPDAAAVRARIDAILAAPSPAPAASAPSSVTPAATVIPAVETTHERTTVADAAPAKAPASEGVARPSASGADASFASRAAVDTNSRTAIALPILVRDPVRVLRAWTDRLALARRFRVGRYSVPLGPALALGALLVVAMVLTLTLVLISSSGDEASVAAVPEKPKDPDVQLLVSKAELGDRDALSALAARSVADRSLVEWRALARGYCRLEDYKACLDAHVSAVAAHPAIGKDADLLNDVRSAAERPELSEQALTFAARSLGASGADLLFDVWDKNKTNSAVGQRARTLLEQEPASSHASAALRAVLSLQAAFKRPRCSEIKQLLGGIQNDVDERSVPLLGRLLERRGCGFLSLGDCYGCLRGGSELSKALATAKGNPRPSFGPSAIDSGPKDRKAP